MAGYNEVHDYLVAEEGRLHKELVRVQSALTALDDSQGPSATQYAETVKAAGGIASQWDGSGPRRERQ